MRVRILAFERMRQLEAGGSMLNRVLMGCFHRHQMRLQRRDQRIGKDRRAVLAALAAAYDAVEPGQLDPQDLLIEEQQRRQRLVLRGSGFLAIDRQVREERLDLRGGHLGRMALAMKQDEATHPEQVLLLCAINVVQRAQLVAHLFAGCIYRRTAADCSHLIVARPSNRHRRARFCQLPTQQFPGCVGHARVHRVHAQRRS